MLPGFNTANTTLPLCGRATVADRTISTQILGSQRLLQASTDQLSTLDLQSRDVALMFLVNILGKRQLKSFTAGGPPTLAQTPDTRD